MSNSRGEKALASSVLTTLLGDIELHEKTHGKRWKKKEKARKETIFRNAADAIYCAFAKNETLDIWLTLVDIPLDAFRKQILDAYPKTCAVMGYAS